MDSFRMAPVYIIGIVDVLTHRIKQLDVMVSWLQLQYPHEKCMIVYYKTDRNKIDKRANSHESEVS